MRIVTSTHSYLMLLLLTIGLLSGCKQPCKDVSCAHGACMEGNCLCNAGWTGPNCDQVDQCYQRTCVNGYCADGSCVCDPFYEGNTCSTPVNEKFIGNWSFSETCTQSGQGGGSIIVQGLPGSLVEFRISNIWSSGTVTASVGTDRQTFSIARQLVTWGYDLESTSATISADGKTIAIAYAVFDAGQSTLVENCTATWTKY